MRKTNPGMKCSYIEAVLLRIGREELKRFEASRRTNDYEIKFACAYALETVYQIAAELGIDTVDGFAERVHGD